LGRYAPDFAEAAYILCVAGRAPHPEGTRGCPYDACRGKYLPLSAPDGPSAALDCTKSWLIMHESSAHKQ